MGSFPGKIIGVILCFILLIFAPLIILVLTQNIRTERTTWNALTYYVDMVRDKGMLTVADYEDFVYQLGATMVDYDITISVQRRLIVPGSVAETYEIHYVTAGLWKSSGVGLADDQELDAGDSVQVILKPLSRTQADNVMSSVLGLHMNRNTITYAATVRNDGSGED